MDTPVDRRYDVVVAGAGPAGAVAARTLALAGLRTLIVDRAEFPRNKPCGGGISTRVTRRFPWMRDVLSQIDVHRVARLRLEGPAGATMVLETPEPCVLLVRRVELDAALVRTAIDAGAELATKFEVTQVATAGDEVTLQARDGRRVSALHVIAADGVHSVIAKRTRVNPRWARARLAIDMMEETPTASLRAERPDELWVAYAYDGLDGYAYVFPKTHHVNVGIGCLLSHFDEEVAEPPYALQERFVSTLVDRGVLQGRSEKACFTPFLIPVGGPLPRAWQGRILFAGDAGGFVHAVTAEGIYYAMVSGELAGRAVADAHRAGPGTSAGSSYEKLWRSELGAELQDAVYVQRYLFSSHSRVGGVVRRAATLPGLTDLILRYVRGDISYGTLRRRMLWRFPRTIFRMTRERMARRGVAAI